MGHANLALIWHALCDSTKVFETSDKNTMKTIYDESRERVKDPTLPEGALNRRMNAFKDAGDGLTYPCCPYCGERRGEDNDKKLRGELCDLACVIAWKRDFDGKDFTESETRLKLRLREVELEMMLDNDEG